MADLRLGGHVDPATHTRTDTAAGVPSDELTTHGVIVGMTGSGKTGLGVVLIEECLRAGIPALLIDPKGDLTNLALTFPGLSAPEFQPWVNESDATKAGKSPAEFAAAQAQSWATGLAGWDLGPADVANLRNSADVTIYTPGAPHGVELNIIGTLDVPADISDPQATAEEIEAYVGSILNLVGIAADPLSSREHILLSNLINYAWQAGRSLDLATLVASVQSPPIRKVGVLELDAYYPPADRMKLAMQLNGLLAAPAFAAWMRGARIDIDSMLRTPDGRARCAVVTTAHLSDEQRQSATSVILAKLISWMRRQSGTSDLRALLYMDEVAGYLPPVGAPPTKAPIMLLLKQARAFGIGVVLSTQNPVDVDYKALSNAGTWMIGRLQTEQDKARLVAGLTSAAGAVDPKAVAETISGLGKREFLLKRASKDTVAVFTTRWAMSYLRGPMTRDQVARLKAGAAPVTAQPATAHPASPAPAAPVSPEPADSPAPARQLAADETPVPPKVATGIPVFHLDPAATWAASVGAVPGQRRVPGVIARVNMRFDNIRAGIVVDQEYEAILVPITESPSPTDFRAVDYDDRDLIGAPETAAYQLPPSVVTSKTWWTALQRALAEHLVATQSIEIPTSPELKLYGRIGEPEAEFMARAMAAAHDGADREIAALQTKYERKILALQRKLETAQQALDRQRSARNATVTSDALGGLLGGLFGGRRTSATTAVRRVGTANDRVNAAADKVDDLARGMADLQAELDLEAAGIRREWTARAEAIEALPITLTRSDVRVASIGLVWIPQA